MRLEIGPRAPHGRAAPTASGIARRVPHPEITWLADARASCAPSLQDCRPFESVLALSWRALFGCGTAAALAVSSATQAVHRSA
jgi:hypothetical protein